MVLKYIYRLVMINLLPVNHFLSIDMKMKSPAQTLEYLALNLVTFSLFFYSNHVHDFHGKCQNPTVSYSSDEVKISTKKKCFGQKCPNSTRGLIKLA